jgi:hypothetical protein
MVRRHDLFNDAARLAEPLFDHGGFASALPPAYLWESCLRLLRGASPEDSVTSADLDGLRREYGTREAFTFIHERPLLVFRDPDNRPLALVVGHFGFATH